MNRLTRWHAIMLTLLIAPCIQASEGFEDTSVREEPTRSTSPSREEEMQQEIKVREAARTQAKAMSDHKDWTASDHDKTTTYSSKTRLPEEPVDRFTKVKRTISKFLSNLFGDGSSVESALRKNNADVSQNVRDNNEAYINNDQQHQPRQSKALDSSAEAAFKRLPPDHQLEQLNDWLKVEKKKYDSALKEHAKRQEAQHKDSATRVKQQQEDIKNVQKDNAQKLSTLKDILNKKGVSSYVSSLTPEEQQVYADALNGKIDPLDTATMKNLDSLVEKIIQQRKNILVPRVTELRTTLKALKRNGTKIKEITEDITDEQHSAQADGIIDETGTHEEFNRRINRFRTEIQQYVPDNVQVVYNKDTGTFEYHRKTETRPEEAQPEVDETFSSFDFVSHEDAQPQPQPEPTAATTGEPIPTAEQHLPTQVEGTGHEAAPLDAQHEPIATHTPEEGHGGSILPPDEEPQTGAPSEETGSSRTTFSNVDLDNFDSLKPSAKLETVKQALDEATNPSAWTKLSDTYAQKLLTILENNPDIVAQLSPEEQSAYQALKTKMNSPSEPDLFGAPDQGRQESGLPTEEPQAHASGEEIGKDRSGFSMFDLPDFNDLKPSAKLETVQQALDEATNPNVKRPLTALDTKELLTILENNPQIVAQLSPEETATYQALKTKMSPPSYGQPTPQMTWDFGSTHEGASEPTPSYGQPIPPVKVDFGSTTHEPTGALGGSSDFDNLFAHFQNSDQ